MTERLKAASNCKVCAIGACIRAEYELLGELTYTDEQGPYILYNYVYEDERAERADNGSLWHFNDHTANTAEEVAAELRRRATVLENPFNG